MFLAHCVVMREREKVRKSIIIQMRTYARKQKHEQSTSNSNNNNNNKREKKKNKMNKRRIPVENIMPRITLNKNIDSTSLMVVTAMIMVWMPLYRPSFSIFNQSTMSMTTFGDTAVMINLDICIYLIFIQCVTKKRKKVREKEKD